MNEILTSPIAKISVIVIAVVLLATVVASIIYVIKKIKLRKKEDLLQAEKFEKMMIDSVEKLKSPKPIIEENISFETIREVEPQPISADINPINSVIKKLTAANLYVGSEGFLIENGTADKNSQIVKLKGGKYGVILTEFPCEEKVGYLIKRYDLILISTDGDKVFIIESLGNYIGDKLNFQL